MVYLLFYKQEVILPHSNKLVKILGYSGDPLLPTLPAVLMNDVHQDFMREWARDNGRLCSKEQLDRTTEYKSGTLPLNMYQTEEQIGEKSV